MLLKIETQSCNDLQQLTSALRRPDISWLQENGRAASPQTCRLHVGHLTRNVNDAHIKEIFGTFGALKSVELAIDRVVNLPRGFAYVEFENRADAEKAKAHMHGGQLDGNVLRCEK